MFHRVQTFLHLCGAYSFTYFSYVGPINYFLIRE